MTFWKGFEKRASELDQLHKDQIPGGKADRRKPSDFDQQELAQGIKVEMEHTSDARKALEIAMDHLAEDREYYTKLRKIHRD